MKKAILLFLICICLFSVFSCGDPQEKAPALPPETEQGGDELPNETPGEDPEEAPDDGWTGDVVLPK